MSKDKMHLVPSWVYEKSFHILTRYSIRQCSSIRHNWQNIFVARGVAKWKTIEMPPIDNSLKLRFCPMLLHCLIWRSGLFPTLLLHLSCILKSTYNWKALFASKVTSHHIYSPFSTILTANQPLWTEVLFWNGFDFFPFFHMLTSCFSGIRLRPLKYQIL